MSKHGLSSEVKHLLQEALAEKGLLAVPEIGETTFSWKQVGAEHQDRSGFEEFLLRRHGEEIAHLCYLAARHRLEHDPQSSCFTHWPEIPETIDTRRPRFEALCRVPAVASMDEECQLLVAYFASSGRTPSAYRLARASHALWPRDEALLVSSLALRDEGRHDEALRLLRGIRADAETPNRMLALANAGSIHGDAGRIGHSIDLFRSACELDEPRAFPAFNWFTEALRAADRDQARRAATALEERAPQSPPETDGCFQALKLAITNGTWKLDPRDASLLPSLQDRVPETAARILHVIQDVD